jgi:hypothetical protein
MDNDFSSAIGLRSPPNAIVADFSVPDVESVNTVWRHDLTVLEAHIVGAVDSKWFVRGNIQVPEQNVRYVSFRQSP